MIFYRKKISKIIIAIFVEGAIVKCETSLNPNKRLKTHTELFAVNCCFWGNMGSQHGICQHNNV